MRAFNSDDHVPDPLPNAFPADATSSFAWCLEHHALEDQMSPIGLVCPCCKHRLYVSPPQGRCRSFWESQPAARSIDGQPQFVYTLVWDDFRIRSLHVPGVDSDPRGPLAQLMLSAD